MFKLQWFPTLLACEMISCRICIVLAVLNLKPDNSANHKRDHFCTPQSFQDKEFGCTGDVAMLTGLSDENDKYQLTCQNQLT